MNFSELEISPELKRGIEDLGFTEMFPIQVQAIPKMLNGRNVIGQAKTGTGKTAAFGIPMIQRIDWDDRHVQGLIIAHPGAGSPDSRRPHQLRQVHRTQGTNSLRWRKYRQAD